MKVFGYIRIEPNSSIELNKYYDFFNSFGFNLEKNKLIIEEATVDTPIKYRDTVVDLVKYDLDENNILIVKGLDSLGSNFKEIYDFLNLLDEKKIILICLDYSTNEINGELKKLFFNFIKMAVELENNK